MNALISRRRCLAAAMAAMPILPMAGCGAQAHAVDPSRAREALKVALDHWKNGEDPRSLASSSTPMTVQDLEWAGGARLVDYRILDEGKAYDANLRVRVELTLDGSGKSKKPATRVVWYLVGTSPSVTVFRDMLRR